MVGVGGLMSAARAAMVSVGAEGMGSESGPGASEGWNGSL